MMRMRWLATLGVALSVLLSGCQGSLPVRKGASDPAAPSSTGQVVRVVVGDGDPVLDALVAAFYERHPDYRIDLVPLPTGGGALNSLAGLLREGKADVVYVPAIEAMTKGNLLADLTPYLQKSKLDLKPYGAVLANMYLQGKLYDLPVHLQPDVLAYNRDLLAQSGVSAPTGPWTWDDLRVAAGKMKSGDAQSRVWGFDPYLVEDVAAIWLTQQTGGDATDAKAADLHAALSFFGAMITDGIMPAPALRTWDRGVNAQPSNPLLAGRAAFGVTNLTNLLTGGTARRKQFGLAYMPQPAAGKPVATTYAETFGIAATAPNPEGAWEFLRFMAGPEGAQVTAKKGGLPAYLTPAAKQAWLEQSTPLTGSDVLFDTQWVLAPRTAVRQARAAALYNMLNQTLAGQASADTAVTDYLHQRAADQAQP